MRKTDPPGHLQEGFELSPAPPIGPDGVPQFAVPRPPLPPRPRLCEAGPCQHYHRLEIQVDAENPMSRTVPVRLPVLAPGMEASPGGTSYRAPAVFHTAVEHYCYPELGIETSLGPTPVVECNRWRPISPDASSLALRAQLQFFESPEGRSYRDAVAAWETAREREAEAEAEAERQMADALKAQEDLARIDDLVASYTYVVESGGIVVPKHFASCLEVSATCADFSEPAALEAVRAMVRMTLIVWNREGRELPVPLGSELPTAPKESDET